MDRYIVKTSFGLEQLLEKELLNLGAEKVNVLNRAVEFYGDTNMMYKANLHLRTALKILKVIGTFKATNPDELYAGIRAIAWKKYFALNDTFAVEAIANTENFNHSGFVALRSKDAIVDYFRDEFGRRPNVDTQRPIITVNVHISINDCTVSLDTSGESLFKRGYRTDAGIAPINEVLAAGMILLSGWDGKSNFIDPMCGSGTLAIEAAMMAYNIAPGSLRKEFAFERWFTHDNELWENLLAEANDNITDLKKDFEIVASDKMQSAINKAEINIKNAGLTKLIRLKTEEIQKVKPPIGGGVAVMNPPYGERIASENPKEFFRSVGDSLKQNFLNYDVWIISSDVAALKEVGLRPTQKIKLFNGAIECSYRKFSIYDGSKKMKFEKQEI